MKIVFRNGRAVTVDDRGYEVDVQPTSNLSATQQRIAANQAAERRMEEEVRVEADEIVAPLPLLPKEENAWFQKSNAFDDGYQFGDVMRTILGTAADIGENLGAGIMGMGEKALDAIAYISPLLEKAQFYQNGGEYLSPLTQQKFDESIEQKKDLAADFIKKDLYDEAEIAKKIIGEADKNTILGQKSAGLVQSGGQLLGTMALQAAGVPWFLTTGATSFGDQAASALNDGADYEEAGLSAAVSAGAEILSEKLSGGIKFGGNTLDDALVKNLSRKISNKVVRSLAKLGVDAVGEGAEEVVSQVISNLGTALYKEDNIGQLLASEEAIDEYIDSFIGGAALGGVSGGFNAIKSAANGVDYASGLTKNEQKVVDKVYKDRVTEAEKNGKVKEKEKSKIYDNVLSDMEQGRISTDTIEEVLGGNSYTSWKNTVDSEEAVKKELDTLNNIKKSDLTGAQEDRLNELKGKLEDIKKNSKRNDLKNQLGSEVMTMVKGDRLIESYNERSRRGQAYQADLSKYDEKQRATIQKAMESKILNNTNRTHEFVDLVAKISADTGMTFDFTNNKKLQESGFAIEGKTVNGYKTKDGVTVNIESAKALNSVVGHEITHVLEGTELYSALQDAVKNYAIHKEGLEKFNARMKATEQLYKGIGDPDMELTADLVGDYLFADADFINRLSTEHRNVFEKLYDNIKYLCRVVTAGSKEARELERVKKKFEDAYRAAKNTTAESGVKYSLSGRTNPTYEELAAKNPIHIVDVKTGIESGSYADMKAAALKTATEEGWFDRPHHNADTDSFIFLTEKSYTHAYSNLTSSFGEDTIRCMAHIPEIIENAVLVRVDDPKNPFKQETKVYTFFGAVDGVNGTEPVKLTVKEFDFKSLDSVPQNIRSYFEKNGAAEQYNSLYDAHALEVVGIEGIKKEPDASGKVNEQSSQAQATSDSTISIEELLNLVKGDAEKYVPKRNYSLSSNEGNINSEYAVSDSDGRQLSSEQQEYFKDSKVRDENGSLKVMYHGTPNGDFTVFKDGTYFTDNKEYADRYQNPGASSISSGKTATNPKTFEVYLDIKKPFDISDAEARDIYINEYIKGGNALGINPYLSDAEYDKIKTVDWTEGEDLRDFLIDNGYDYDGLVLDEGADGGYGDEVSYRGKSYVVFSPEQVKGVVNQTPTADPDIRHSLSNTNEQFAPIGSYNVYGSDVALVEDDIGPVKRTTTRAEASIPNKAYANSWKLENKPLTGKNIFKDNIIDRGTIFETMSLKTGNRELQAKWKAINRAESSAQWFMEHGNTNTKSLKSIMDEVEKTGKTKKFEDYLYHMHNVDRMKVNKPVFGSDTTAELSQAEATRLEHANPEFKRWANDVYFYMGELREMMVENGMISEQTRDLLMNMYPHYVPIRRSGKDVEGYSSTMDTKRTGVKDPIKKATGGNRKIEPLFDTMAMRTEEVFKAIAKNNFGLELKNMLGTTVDSETAVGEDVIENVGDEVVKPSKDGREPTFSVYENGERVTFDINDEMYRAMKPKGDFATYTNKALNKAGNFRRGLLTEYNPAFMLTNPIKDTQDVLINSQHPARTYANYPKAIAELWGKKGQYYREYMEHGGSDNTYFDGKEKAFVKKDTGFKKAIGFPLEKISQANNFIERVPRMAEYIASREMGRSIDVSMLDAARVTTDFSAGGDFVKTLNRNGFTFLNASVQGAVQTVRNVREAKAEGIKGWAKLAAKTMVAGLAGELLNNLLWDDDEDYENLSDYVKQNYYVVGKYDDGKFVRIPKGRAVAVIQNAFEQMNNLITGDDAVDLKTFGELVLNNLAPANPMENNLIAPLAQAFRNETWYGDDLVPSRLQDIPAAEQYDETTDSISKWLGEKAGSVGIDISPYKINYVLDQYSGAIGDVFLPMLTPEAERGNDSKWADLIAPISDKFTTDSVLKNQNVTDFYSVRDELKKVANGKNATKEDLLSKVFADAVSWDMSDLYAQKREIQNSDLPDSEKYNHARELQKKINALAEEGLNGYKDVYSNGVYAEVGGRRFNYSPEKDTWYEITPTYSDGSENRYYTQEQLFKNNLGVSYEDYWNGKFDPAKDKVKTHYAKMNGKRYNFSDEKNTWYELKPKNDDGTDNWYYQKEQEVTKGLGIGYEEYWNNREEYNYAYDHPQSYAIAKSVGGYDEYVSSYYPYLVDKDSGVYIFADKDANGDSIAYSRQKKVKAWLQELDIPEMDKLLLYKSVYNSYDDRNYEIIEYLNSNKNLTYEDRVNALRGMGFTVTDDGNISWK